VQYERLTYPPYDAPLADAYSGIFESAYVLLHPFISVPDHLAWNATQQYPTDEQITSVGSKCTWACVTAQTGLQNFAKLNQALLTSIGSISEELCDYPARDALKGLLESESIWMPNEGNFEPLLQTDFLDTFTTAGQEELIYVPEFPQVDPIQQLSVQRLKNREIPFPSRGSLVAPDESFLLTVDWDSFFTLFYGPRALLSEVVRAQNLEGFFVTTITEHFWFNYAMGCSIVTVSPELCPTT
jgi:hypothetical protein